LYTDLAEWWHLLSHPDEYRDEAAFFTQLFGERGIGFGSTVLELGCGGGNNASHMKATFRMTLTDLSENMLAVSRRLNPECRHVQGDMRELRLDECFDGVFVHDAVAYMTTAPDLRAALETAYLHTRAGGIALFVPDDVAETFTPSTDHGGHDEVGSLRGLRYLEWEWDPDPNDTEVIGQFAYLLRHEDGTSEVRQDRHRWGLFPRQTWIGLIEEIGFRVEVVADPDEERDVFIGHR